MRRRLMRKHCRRKMDIPVIGMNYGILLTPPEDARGGSSDVGDVTLVVPTVALRYPVRVPGSASHHWAVVSCGATSIAHKGITAGAKVSALSAYDIITDPSKLFKIKAEHEKLTKERPYKSFLPPNVTPPLGFYSEMMHKFRGLMEAHHTEDGSNAL